METTDFNITLRPVAYIRSPFPEKFGIPRQSGLTLNRATVVFIGEFKNREALRGIEEYSHLWLIWGFSEAKREKWSPTVRPPRLGGNVRMGVFSTRSPYRPNPLGLSSVKLLSVNETENDGLTLTVEGADLLDGTPIYDIKPYLPFTDCHRDAVGGFADRVKDENLEVVFPEEWKKVLPESLHSAVISLLSQDPRPHYQDEKDRIYGFSYSGYEIRFQVDGERLTVVGTEKI